MTNPRATNAHRATTAVSAGDGEHPWRYTATLANDIEARWQTYWDQHHTFTTPNPADPGFDAARPRFYCLDMFPYPSGAGLHVGHPLGYIATDIMCRYKRMRGFNVLHPMGFDAFGLPAEQFAVEHGVHPRVTTERNIATMVRQLKALGLSYDWTRRIATTEPAYYKWTQWIFLQLYNSYYDSRDQKAKPISELLTRLESGALFVGPDGDLQPGDESARGGRRWSELSREERDAVLAEHRLAYMAEVSVNWCPALGTVLANEEVTNEGRSERGNHPVYKQPLRQWMLRITAYADRLADDLKLVDWPEPIKLMQRNWIGRSEGAMIEFPIAPPMPGTPAKGPGPMKAIRVFTTRPDTIYGATYMVLAAEHPLVNEITTDRQRDAVREYVRLAALRSDVERQIETRDKTGVATGAFAINPATGEQIPVWIADYVLMGYGTGAIMAVPGQDQRDWEFAEAFNLPIIRTVQPPDGFEGKAYTGDGPAINSGFLNGLLVHDAKQKIVDWLQEHGSGWGTTAYKLRDWLFSRQRYWGEPFPILHGPDGEIVAVEESELPVLLPEVKDFTPHSSDDPEASPRPPLARAPKSWRYVQRDGLRFQRELNTMPQWAGSCWYYLRFLDPKNDQRFVDPAVERYWLSPSIGHLSDRSSAGSEERTAAPGGVDLYVGGVEHAVLHLLYARFWHKVLYDLGHISTPEPFARLFNQGYIQAYAYTDERGMYVDADKIQETDGAFSCEDRPVARSLGKMGKSLKNAVSPDNVCAKYGCDTLRLYEMYMGPLEASKPWNTRDISGPFRFLQRLWRLAVNEQTGELTLRDECDPKVERQLHHTIAKVGEDVERLAYNTAIAAMIEFVNVATTAGGLTHDQLKRFVLILAAFAPHIAEELWSRLGHEKTLAHESWPAYDDAMLVEDSIALPVQVGGRIRAKVTVPADAGVKQIEAAVLADEKVAALLADKTVRKVTVVPGKIVNIVAD